MHITITEQELCAALCALYESAATATEMALLAPDGPGRQALLANADVYSKTARALRERDAAAYAAARNSSFGQQTSGVTPAPMPRMALA